MVDRQWFYWSRKSKKESRKIEIKQEENGSTNQKSEENTTNNLKMFCKASKRDSTLFDGYTTIESKTKHEAKHEKRLKILTPKQMLQILPIALAQVKAGDIFEDLLNEIRQIIFSFHQEKEIATKIKCIQ